jgi:hypothetical protein
MPCHATVSHNPPEQPGSCGPSRGLGWLEVECNRCKTRASLPLDAIRRARDTPLWKLEASLKCRSCRLRDSPYAPPVRMIKLTAKQMVESHETLSWAELPNAQQAQDDFLARLGVAKKHIGCVARL